MVNEVGVDEVGRGSWAGPLVAGAVMLPAGYVHAVDAGWRLADSKLLSKPQRLVADEGVRSVALAVGLGWVDSAEVDALGLTAAVTLAMRRAVAALGIPAERIIIDGSINFLKDIDHTEAKIKADATVPAVSAASIIAKVARDNWMAGEAARLYPQYGFERHVGYGTAEHAQALRQFGACAIHRRSFRPVRQYAQ